MRKWLIFCLLCLPLAMRGREYVDLSSAQIPSLDDKVWERKGHALAAACTYRSIDQFGDSITLSGKLFIPKEGKAERIILCPHFTISAPIRSSRPGCASAWTMCSPRSIRSWPLRFTSVGEN